MISLSPAQQRGFSVRILPTHTRFLLSLRAPVAYTFRMYLKSLELNGFKSFGKKSTLGFATAITAVVGPNGSGKSNTAESFRFALGEQSIKSLRGKRGEDLIWGGSTSVPRSNRASVKLTFDNTKRLLHVDYDEVVIERVVYRDGTNEYLINDSKVRLKDVTELLAGANIGASGHHIISQGEADRVLAASPRERRHMIEDALGLRVYQYKKDESMKKLAKTEENKSQVEALRRENAPHLKFLERQVRKLERARELRNQLVSAYHEYLKREEGFLAWERETVRGLQEEPERSLKEIEAKVREARVALERAKGGDAEAQAVVSLEESLRRYRQELTAHERAVGRIEGQVAYEERRIDDHKRRAQHEDGQPIPYSDVRDFWNELTRVLDSAHGKNGAYMESVQGALKSAQALVRKFIERHLVREGEREEPDTSTLDGLRSDKAREEREVERLTHVIADAEGKVRQARDQIDVRKDANRDLERALFAHMSRETELRATLARLALRERARMEREEEFKREVGEGIALIGKQILGYKDYEVPGGTVLDLDADDAALRAEQAERKRELEKLKIRLEEMGGASADEITKEYQEVSERDQFLERELADLERSAGALRSLINDLDRELSDKFKAGVTAISVQFNTFFALMFGGGSATLSVVTEKKKGIFSALFGARASDDEGEAVGVGGEEEATEEGVDIEVSLPKKRIQSLVMLSGGERALTSIALIFAMSQVNPPPFLILDETDAALDEANSKRYGDMIATLAQKSQLILITHNRETMSRAGMLYGVTMGLDGVSKILSVKFEDAAANAK